MKEHLTSPVLIGPYEGALFCLIRSSRQMIRLMLFTDLLPFSCFSFNFPLRFDRVSMLILLLLWLMALPPNIPLRRVAVLESCSVYPEDIRPCLWHY